MPDQTLQLKLIFDNKGALQGIQQVNAATGKVGKQTEKVGKQQTSALKKMRAGWVAVAGAVLGVAAAMTKAIAKAAEFEEANAKFGTVFRGVSKEANAMRKELVASYGLSTTEATRFLSSVQDLFVPLGLSRDKAAELSGETVKLARDIASFNKLPTGDVLRDIQSAMVGNFETVRKYGVVLSATNITQRAMAEGLKVTNGQVSAQDRAMLALKMITEGSSDAMGDFQRTSDSWSNTMVQVKAIAEDVTVSIGQKMVSAIKPTVLQMSNFLKSEEGMKSLNDAVNGVVTIFLLLKSVIATVFNLAQGLIGGTVKLIKRDFSGALEAVTKNVMDIGEEWTKTVGQWEKIWSQRQKVTLEGLDAEFEADAATQDAIVARRQLTTEELKLIANIQKEEEKAAFNEKIERLYFELGVVQATEEQKDAIRKAYHDMELARAKELLDVTVSGLSFIAGAAKQYHESRIAFMKLEGASANELASAEKKAAYEVAKFQKAASVTQSIANTAEAVTKALAIAGPFGLALAATIGAAGAIQTAAILSQPLPKLKKGGFLPGYGGGDRIPALLEGGEFVVNKQSSRAFAPLLESINALKLQAGGPVSNRTENVSNLSFAGAQFNLAPKNVSSLTGELMSIGRRTHSRILRR